MLLDITHDTSYRYHAPANYSVQYLRITPRTDRGQRVLSWRIDTPGRRWAQRDAFGNIVHTLSIVEPHERIRIHVHGTVETRDEVGMSILDAGSIPPTAYLFATPLTAPNEDILELSQVLVRHRSDRHEGLLRLAETIEGAVKYLPGSTDVQSSAIEALHQGAGVCQDHAHLFIACCRAVGIPARYVSGYLFTGEQQHLASHAWGEAWSDEGGWLEVDITNTKLCGPQTCRLAVGRDYLDASPVRGVRRGGGQEALEVTVKVNMIAQQ
jgi:transglutaminase-like putative cysteine protease